MMEMAGRQSPRGGQEVTQLSPGVRGKGPSQAAVWPGAVPRARDRVSVPCCPLTSSPPQWKQQQTDVKPQLPKPRDCSPAMPTGWLRSCLEARGHSSHLPAPGWGWSNSAVGVTQNLAPKRVCRGWSYGAMKHLSLGGLCSTSALLHPQFLPCQGKP